jgi:hypothetical protein
MFTLGYDPEIIRVMIANAHSEWPFEERQIYLAGSLEGCVHVWCVRLAGEWKILAHKLPCGDEVDPPTPPEAPADLYVDDVEEPVGEN